MDHLFFPQGLGQHLPAQPLPAAHRRIGKHPRRQPGGGHHRHRAGVQLRGRRRIFPRFFIFPGDGLTQPLVGGGVYRQQEPCQLLLGLGGAHRLPVVLRPSQAEARGGLSPRLILPQPQQTVYRVVPGQRELEGVPHLLPGIRRGPGRLFPELDRPLLLLGVFLSFVAKQPGQQRIFFCHMDAPFPNPILTILYSFMFAAARGNRPVFVTLRRTAPHKAGAAPAAR